ncbi:MAG: ferredoxin [Gammaproteobacteria bacterium]
MSTMNPDLLNFHLTGRHATGADPAPGYRPALTASYGELTGLRYDFPVVLLGGTESPAFVDSLTGVINRLLGEIAHEGNAGTLLRQHVLRLERRMRELAAGRPGISLTELWEEAAQTLLGECGEREAELLGNSLATARFGLRVDGPVLDCDDAMPVRLLQHAWGKVEARRTGPTRERIEALIIRLREMLKVDDLKGRASRSPERLRQTFGRRYREAFDFELMAEMLEGSTPHNPLPEARRNRIAEALAALESQRFFVPFDGERDQRCHDFVFYRLSAALRAWHERLPEIADVIRAIEIAELEVDNAFRDERHPAYFERFGPQALTPEDLALFPSYLVCVRQSECNTRDTARLMEIVAEELPVKVLLQVGDALASASAVDGSPRQGSAIQQLPHTFVAGNAYLLQLAGSDLYRQSEQVLRGLEFDGPAVFSIYVPREDASNVLPPYLAAAAATESRVFPGYTYDPTAGAGLAERFDIGGNPDVDDDWPRRELRYEDEALQTVTEDYRFTLADFAVTDPHYAGHFEPVERLAWDENMLPVADYLDLVSGRDFDKVPYVAVVDADNRLRRMIVDDHLVRITRRCRDRWHTLQELGGVHNSWAEAAQAAARSGAAGADRAASSEAAPGTEPAAAEPPVEATSDAAVPVTETEEAVEAQGDASDEAWIETPRCTTCDECTTRSPRMFAYDDNRQAYIRDPDAGTFRDLVEAAENCQVAIIHPGKPRNPDEPGLDDLIARAAPFNT